MTASREVASKISRSKVALGLAILVLVVGTCFLVWGDQGIGTALIVVGVIDLVFIGIYRAAKAASLLLKASQPS